ncbi:response regulator [Denitrobaculum tricleocarpae]|uniref:Response regulator n=1 Tax=Denitrobaculum tricleocarpae TaxID=2591009 RepID=A0A545TR74_9PROT|nr:response regulator [Denitrobaculum tricleocarpae]TQV79720.1 response regulator [Denitrobaculum tricleocarpae]
MTISVVLVDDDEIDRYITRRIVQAGVEDSRFAEYEAGDAFLEAIADPVTRERDIGVPPPPVLILLDINMPRMTGFDVLESMKEHLERDESLRTGFKVMMFSSSENAKDRETAFSYDFVKDYIVKPLTKQKLQALVKRHYS